MEPVIIEILKLRRSASWGVVLVLPVASVLSACVIVRPTDWQLLWIRNWNALMSSSVPTWRTVVAKAIAAWLPAAVMQLVLVLASAAVGSLVLGLPGVLPVRCLAAGALIAVACAPACALQTGLSAFTRSFALPVAVGLVLTGAGTTMLLVHVPVAWLLPQALVTRTTQIGAVDEGAATSFAVQDLTWVSAISTIGACAALSVVIVIITSMVLDRTDARG